MRHKCTLVRLEHLWGQWGTLGNKYTLVKVRHIGNCGECLQDIIGLKSLEAASTIHFVSRFKDLKPNGLSCMT